LFGLGPGASDRLAHAVSSQLLSPLLPKVLVDYGALTGVLLFAFFAVSFLRGPCPALVTAMVASYAFLNEAVLLPIVVITLWMVTSMWSDSGGTPPAVPHPRWSPEAVPAGRFDAA
jgi:hypothetical protein